MVLAVVRHCRPCASRLSTSSLEATTGQSASGLWTPLTLLLLPKQIKELLVVDLQEGDPDLHLGAPGSTQQLITDAGYDARVLPQQHVASSTVTTARHCRSATSNLLLAVRRSVALRRSLRRSSHVCRAAAVHPNIPEHCVRFPTPSLAVGKERAAHALESSFHHRPTHRRVHRGLVRVRTFLGACGMAAFRRSAWSLQMAGVVAPEAVVKVEAAQELCFVHLRCICQRIAILEERRIQQARRSPIHADDASLAGLFRTEGSATHRDLHARLVRAGSRLRTRRLRRPRQNRFGSTGQRGHLLRKGRLPGMSRCPTLAPRDSEQLSRQSRTPMAQEPACFRAFRRRMGFWVSAQTHRFCQKRQHLLIGLPKRGELCNLFHPLCLGAFLL
eukprot:scaffold3026_cov221-Pinguiococcus_pyrenoidosus.AAC.3